MSPYPKRKREEISYKETPESDDFAASGGDNDDDKEGEEDDWYKTKKTKKRKKSTVRKPRKPRKPGKFPFMKLPAEIRLQIYDLLMVNPDGIVHIESHNYSALKLRQRLAEHIEPRRYSKSTGFHFHRNLRLLRANKVIYNEAADVFYRQVFSFKTALALQTFLVFQRPETLPLLRRIHVDVSKPDWKLMPSLSVQIGQLVGLEKLKISGMLPTTTYRLDKYLAYTERPREDWENSVVGWDKLRSIKLAKDLYPFLFPFFHKVIADRGVGGLTRIFETEFEGNRWQQHGIPFYLTSLFSLHVKQTPDTDERRIIRSTSMAEEVAKLMELDSS